MRKPAILLLATAGLFFTAGCTNLDEVAKLGAASTEARTALAAVSGDFYGSCHRRAEILVRIPVDERPPDMAAVTPNCQPFKDLATHLDADQAVLTGYLDALAELASNKPISASANITANLTTISDFTTASGANADLAADASKAATAALTIAQKLTDVATRHYREKHVRDLILESNDAVQKLTAALTTVVVTDYGLMLNSEKGFLDAYYQGPMAGAHSDQSLSYILVQRQYDTDLDLIQNHRESAADYGAVMKKISTLHAKLAEAAQHPATFNDMVRHLTPDITDLKDAVTKLKAEVK